MEKWSESVVAKFVEPLAWPTASLGHAVKSPEPYGALRTFQNLRNFFLFLMPVRSPKFFELTSKKRCLGNFSEVENLGDGRLGCFGGVKFLDFNF